LTQFSGLAGLGVSGLGTRPSPRLGSAGLARLAGAARLPRPANRHTVQHGGCRVGTGLAAGACAARGTGTRRYDKGPQSQADAPFRDGHVSRSAHVATSFLGHAVAAIPARAVQTAPLVQLRISSGVDADAVVVAGDRHRVAVVIASAGTAFCGPARPAFGTAAPVAAEYATGGPGQAGLHGRGWDR